MKISFVVCGNGYGHLKRVLHVAGHILKMNASSAVQVIAASTHKPIFDDWLKNNEGLSARVVFLNGFTEKNLVNNPASDYTFTDYVRSGDIIRNLIEQSKPDRIVSDNLVGVVEEFPETMLMGSFLWPDILDGKSQNAEVRRICEHEKRLLEAYKPVMIGIKDMVMPFVSKYTRFRALPWFCERNQFEEVEKKNGKVNVLVTGGGTAALTETLSGISEQLVRLDGVSISLDGKLYGSLSLQRDSYNLFGFTSYDFQQLDWIVCRPGIGILTDAVKYGIPVCAVVEKDREMEHNADRIKALGMGIIHNTMTETCEALLARDTHVFRKNILSLETDGGTLAAELILAT